MSDKSSRTHVVILGAGFGGLSVADQLNDWLSSQSEQVVGQTEISLIDAAESFSIGGTNQFLLMDKYAQHQPYFAISYAHLKFQHVKYLQQEITALDLETNTVVTKERSIKYTHLVIALGIKSQPEVIPGLKEAAYDICNVEHVKQLRKELLTVKNGNVVMLVARKPYKCPPAPYEYALLCEEILSTNARDGEVKPKVIVATPDPTPVPLANPGVLTACLKEKDIEFLGKHSVQSVDPIAKTITFTLVEAPKPPPVKKDEVENIWAIPDSEKEVEKNEVIAEEKEEDKSIVISYDVLLATFPQKSPTCLAPLCNEKGLIPVDLMTLCLKGENSKYQNVFALGDNAHMILPLEPKPKPHPKAGGFAINQAKPVAQKIISTIESNSNESEFKQKDIATCYAEVGYDKEVIIEIDLFGNVKKPKFNVSEPSIDNPIRKIQWVKDLIHRWFNVEEAAPDVTLSEKIDETVVSNSDVIPEVKEVVVGEVNEQQVKEAQEKKTDAKNEVTLAPEVATENPTDTGDMKTSWWCCR